MYIYIDGGCYLLKTHLKARKGRSSFACSLALDGTHNKEAVYRGFSWSFKGRWGGKKQGVQNLSMKSHHHNGKGYLEGCFRFSSPCFKNPSNLARKMSLL